MNNRKFTVVLTLVTLLVIIEPSFITTTSAQNNKTIIRRLTLVEQPVEIAYEINGHPPRMNEAVHPETGTRTLDFDSNSEWVKDLTLKLRNTSGKTITYIEVDLSFPEVVKDGRTALHQIFLGVDPNREFKRAELRMAPKQTIEIPLAQRFENIENLVKLGGNLAIEDINKLFVEFQSALFDDETLFQGGMMFRRNPDPNDPNKWIPAP